MGKKTLRFPASSINSKKEELVNKSANIVFRTGSVLFGEILTITPSQLEVKNRRNTIMQILQKDIREIIIDFKS